MKELENQKILIYDIETASVEEKANPYKDKLRFFGCYSYYTNEYYYLTKIDDIKKIINIHDYLVGFNTLKYDNIVLFNNGFSDIIFKNENTEHYKMKYKTNIDLYKIFKDRSTIIKTKKGLMKDLLLSYSLDYITKMLDLVDDESGKIKDFDYNILKKETFTKDEMIYIFKYLKRDIDITKKLYEWLESYFYVFKDFLYKKDIKNKSYLNSTTAVFSYKAICKALDIKEEYSNIKTHSTYGGGYVSYPAAEHFEGDIYCLDYNSLYPNIIVQCNIFSRNKENNEGWNGNNFFKVEGYYNDKTQGKIEKLIKKWYEDRIIFKKNKDPKEHTIKIILNTMYGILGNESFKTLADNVCVADVTRLARQWIKLARKIFKDKGYKIIYSDTDSIYILDEYNNKDKIIEIKDEVINIIKSNVPFPYTGFDMGIDDEISHMWFFKSNNKITIKKSDDEMDEDDYINKPKGLLKKNYIYLTKDNKIVVKDAGIKKKSTSLIVRKIFWDYMVPRIKEEKKIKFEKKWFEEIISNLLNEDLSLISKRYSVNNKVFYKNNSQLQYQISNKYGEGIHFLIPNKIMGVGKGKKYCTIEEFKKNNLTINDIDFKNIWRELEFFIEEKNKQYKLFDFV